MVFTALLIDADPQRVRVLSDALVALGAAAPVEVVDSLAAAAHRLQHDGAPPDLVVAALDLPDGRLLDADFPWESWAALVHVGPGEEALAALAMRRGLSDYFIIDPAQGYLHTFPEQVRAVLAKAENLRRLQSTVQRLDLVLGAVDLGLWDHDLRSGAEVMDERWFALLGHAPGGIETDQGRWLVHVHPAELLRVEHRRQLVLSGDLTLLEMDFRMRHRQGHWIWVHSRGRVVQVAPDGTPLRMVGSHADVTTRKQAELALARQHRLLEAVSRAQNSFIEDSHPQRAFELLLEELLGATDSEYGLVGEVVPRPGQVPTLRIHAMTNIAWDEVSQGMFAKVAEGGMLFDSPDSLLGVTLRTGEPVIANNPEQDVRSSGRPHGHPPLRAYLGLPVKVDGELVALVGLANQPEGYSQDDADFLAPFISTVGQLFRAWRAEQQRVCVQQELQIALDSMDQGLLRVDRDGVVTTFNQRALDLLDLPKDLLAAKPNFNALVKHQKEQGAFGPQFELVDPGGRAYVSDAARLDSEGLPAPGSYWRRTLRGLALEVRTRPLPDGGMVRTYADVTGYFDAQDALTQSEARFRSLVELSSDWYWEQDAQFRFVHVAGALEAGTGTPIEEHLGKTRQALGALNMSQADWAEHQRLLEAHEVFRDLELLRQDRRGNTFWISLSGAPIFDDKGRFTGYRGVGRNIDARMKTQQEVQAARNRLQAILEAIPDPLFEITADGRYAYVSSNDTSLLAVAPEQLLGRSIDEVLSPPAAAVVHGAIAEAAATGASVGRQYPVDLADGTHWFELSVARKPTLLGESERFVMLAHDVTGRKRAEEEIERLAFHDVLTGLPNRRLLLDRLAMAITSTVRAGKHGALLFIDLDNFKDLNDTLGHDRGDELLQLVAQRLQSALRGIDTVARLGGDEFVLMLEGLHAEMAQAASEAEVIGRKILELLNQPYVLAGREHNSSPSIGVALFGHADDTVDELLKRADLAMYRAKIEGRNTLRFFDPQMQAAVLARASLEADLRVGLQRDELALYFQPVVNVRGQMVGAEALVRWRHPQRGMVSPADFIPVAEQSGLIVPLGQWVLERACERLRDWAASPDLAHMSLAVNISAREFRSAGFVAQVSEALARTGIDPARLKLELTESMFLHDADEIADKMNRLKACGLSFSLDDFGTGYSSLSYLKRLPLDQLKIDQSFVRDVLDDPDDAAIVRTILTLAQSLDLTVVAEGVETRGQRDFLAMNGCRQFQGYLFGRPSPSMDDFTPLL
jgi:diguanylate cyclase (GGDEF)-like protein/PAS domain S-box-containing protein